MNLDIGKRRGKILPATNLKFRDNLYSLLHCFWLQGIRIYSPQTFPSCPVGPL